MTKTLRLLLCALLLSLPALHARAETADDVQRRLSDFYVFYCRALNANENLLAHPDKLKPYVSGRFLKELALLGKKEGGIEADPFVCAQDNDPAWEKNVAVANARTSENGETASADVTLGGQKEMVRHLKVTLVSESGVYKVDKVKATDL